MFGELVSLEIMKEIVIIINTEKLCVTIIKSCIAKVTKCLEYNTFTYHLCTYSLIHWCNFEYLSLGDVHSKLMASQLNSVEQLVPF